MTQILSQIHPSWMEVLKKEFDSEYFKNIVEFLQEERSRYQVYPHPSKIFAAFNQTAFTNLKAVILGQDPYHNPGQANGYCFSVNDQTKLPPSLRNIYKELNADLGIEAPRHGNLSAWAKQGVLLLNTVLTVRENAPASHSKCGWQKFTDETIRKISDENEHVVFLLWGKYAQGKKVLINPEKHRIIESAHPSPLSARNGFFGSRPFSRTNQYLISVGREAINWEL